MVGSARRRLVLGSLGAFDKPVYLQESVQFVMPAVSMRAVADPRSARNFTLNQFNLLYDASGEGVDLCQVHFYEYNPASLASLPGAIRRPGAEPALTALLRRVSVGLGYVPGWGSPKVKIVARRATAGSDRLPVLELGGDAGRRWPPMLHALVRSMLNVAPALDLWPAVPMISVSTAAKSYHFGASFPHGRSRTATTTDRTGRLAAWDHIHLVDASVFPDVPATTFTLTIMANAHRIASEALESRGMSAHSTGRTTPNGQPVVAITGASGYLGTVLVAAFGAAGYTVRRLVRSPVQGSADRRFDLTSAGSSDALDGIDLLVHCAYDMALTSRADIWQSNVFGTVALFDRAVSRRGSQEHRAVVDVGVSGAPVSSTVGPSWRL